MRASAACRRPARSRTSTAQRRSPPTRSTLAGPLSRASTSSIATRAEFKSSPMPLLACPSRNISRRSSGASIAFRLIIRCAFGERWNSSRRPGKPSSPGRLNREARGLRQRLLIIGATGFVGSRWAHRAKERFEVIKGARSAPDSDDSVSIDITDPASVAHAFDRARPDLVTHLAALSDIDRCEREPELAERINHHGAIHVAEECARRGARMFYTSTDAVFDGSRGMYHEHDEPTPPNWYGHTKARAERAILERLSSAVVIRLSLVLGRGLEAAGNSYLEKVAGNLAAKNPII